MPPSLPENEVLVMNQSLVPQHLPQYPTPNNIQTKLEYSNKYVSNKYLDASNKYLFVLFL